MSDTNARGTLERGAAIGRYLVLEVLGRGGMGEVYAAYDPELDRRVALKLLHLARGTADAREQLVLEARALGKLSHPNVVQVYDVGKHEGDVFIAMELVEGAPLDEWCVGTPKPSVREITAAFRDAARGLEAAHEKGLVHRDVKPSNILRGKDGRVRVADFGIARDRSAAPGPPSTARVVQQTDALDATMPAASGHGGLAQESTLAGTPLYLAPEQHERQRASPASDQYSLCLALYECLYGHPPFTTKLEGSFDDALDDLLEQKKRGLPPQPPSDATVPAWIHRVLARGLAPAPENRYPSLDALRAALADDPTERRRKVWRRWGFEIVFVSAVLAIGLGWSLTKKKAADPCHDVDKELAGAWDDDLRARLRTAFAGSGRPYADDTATRVVTLLDAYARSWTSVRGEVCEARRESKQSAELLGARDACLDRRRAQLEALTAALVETPNPDVLDKSVQAASNLYPVAYCADTKALAARVPPPDDPAVRVRVAALAPKVDRLEAFNAAGRLKEGLAFGEPVLAEARDLPYAPERARAEYWMATLEEANAQYEPAASLLREAAASASEGRDDVLELEIWARLLTVVGRDQKRYEEATTLRGLAPTVIVRVKDERALAAWFTAEGGAFTGVDHMEEAERALQQALALWEKVGGPDRVEVAAVHNSLGNAYLGLGDPARALENYQSSLAISQKVLGPNHPSVAVAQGNLGNLFEVMGDYQQARTFGEASLATFEASYGPDHPHVAAVLENLAIVLFDTGDLLPAKAKVERALAIQEKAFDPTHPAVADSLVLLGRIELRLGHLDAARASLARALAIDAKPDAPAHAVTYALIGQGELELADKNASAAAATLERALAISPPEMRPDVELALADALWASPKYRPRARELAESARAQSERMVRRAARERAERWLAEHPLP